MNRKKIREFFLIGPIRFYQRFLSPLKPSPTCRFIPCCSAYAATALRRFGFFRGGLMAVCRLLRCNPLCKGGVDPVPHHFTLRPFAGLEEENIAERRTAASLEEQRRAAAVMPYPTQAQGDSGCLETNNPVFLEEL